MADEDSGSSESTGDKLRSGVKSAGRSLMESGQRELSSASSRGITPVKYHRGGKVRKTEDARVKKGERVIPKSRAKQVERLMKKNRIPMTARKKKGRRPERGGR